MATLNGWVSRAPPAGAPTAANPHARVAQAGVAHGSAVLSGSGVSGCGEADGLLRWLAAGFPLGGSPSPGTRGSWRETGRRH
jgi:hypothetical protein